MGRVKTKSIMNMIKILVVLISLFNISNGQGRCKCGRANHQSRIVNGVTTEKNEYPWQVLLYIKVGNRAALCGGTIVSSKSIVTAAHCTKGRKVEDIFVSVGDHDITVGGDGEGERTYRVCSKDDHSQYNPRNMDYDYSVLTLCYELQFTDTVSPACLPYRNKSYWGMRYENKAAVISGWGATSAGGQFSPQLQKANVTTMKNWQYTKGNFKYPRGLITPRIICATSPGTDTCQGDSGGPLVVQENGAYFLVGITSFGIGCAHPNYPGVYARVSMQNNWIKSKIEGTSCRP